MSARDDVLARIRKALGDRPEPAAVQRDYLGAGQRSGEQAALLGRLTERLVDYRAAVQAVPTGDVGEAVGRALARHGARRVAVPDGFPPQWLTGVAVEGVTDTPPLSAADLDGLDGVVSTSRLAIADTGTIVLDGGPGQGRRALTLVPDLHVVVVRAADVVAGVPDALAVLDPRRPLTWISGPSATSDIELSRVEGVHGPRTLEVVVAS